MAKKRTNKKSLQPKRTHEVWQENQEKYRTILQSIEELYYEVDLAGNLIFFNDSMIRILGYSRDELIGMNNRTYMDEETNDHEIDQSFFNRIWQPITFVKR